MSIPQPDIRPIADGKYRLESTYRLRYEDGAKRVVFKIRPGFIHDGASVPRLVWTISGLRPDGLLRAAALIHDALYQNCGALPLGWIIPMRRPFTRSECDVIFREIMKLAGVGWWKRKVAYAGVRTGGWASWRKHRRRIQNEA